MSSCPLGKICDGDKEADCRLLRRTSVVLGYGDLFAGIYCPANRSDAVNCPAGSYCPDPVTILPCPKDAFCPHKTAEPDYECRQCDVGSTSLQREYYGYVVICFLGGLAVTFIVWKIFRRYNRGLVQKIHDLQDRSLSEISSRRHMRQQQRQMEQIRPKINLICERLGMMDSRSSFDEQSHASTKSGSSKTSMKISPSKKKNDQEIMGLAISDDGRIKFNASRLFDFIDTDSDGLLSYPELNTILELNPGQLKEFVQTMNELAGEPPHTETLSKPVFLKYFIPVLAESSNFGPTAEDAARLFDEIAKQGTDKYGRLLSSSFYKSSLATFLTDTEINDLIKRFRRRRGLTSHSYSIRNFTEKSMEQRGGISKKEFVEMYPVLLTEVTSRPDPLPSERPEISEDELVPVDIAFEELNLAVKVGEKSIKVVNNVTGRLQASTMTALMGGSGAGKSSLLNALCGRAFYGEVTGSIKVNGKETTIEEQKSTVGFVPQDDIVYAELTVKENFIFSGKFQLPVGTPLQAIEDLADATLANLGLSRVADSLVGDVNRRGVSGGEKKRVNIGLELMAKPRVLFLDEPTSGLDASSALLVMKSLKNLVETQDVTVCSVIHQPRKHIYDLFDSLILLGVGGRMVYHGPAAGAFDYFRQLNYVLPEGESVADWLIDISSGRLQPEENGRQEDTAEGIGMRTRGNGPSANKVEEQFELAKINRERLYGHWKNHFESLTDSIKAQYLAPEASELPKPVIAPKFWRQLAFHIHRNLLVIGRNKFIKVVDTCIIVGAVVLISAFEGIVEVTKASQPHIPIPLMFASETEVVKSLASIFKYAWSASVGIQEYLLKLGVILGVLIGLTATKVLTEKRLEFFREAGSGYDINAYYIAVNITSTLETFVQTILAAAAAVWLRNTITNWISFQTHFFLLGWLCVSWGLFFPLVIPLKNVVLVTGFFMAFFGLLFSGGLDPVTYHDIYDSDAMALFCAFISPTRFFIEALAVGEHKCLPEQSGFTIKDSSFNYPRNFTSFTILGLAQNDSGVVDQFCYGWYWSVLPALFVGLTVRFLGAGLNHVMNRSKQAKRPLLEELQNKLPIKIKIGCFVGAFIGIFALTSWLVLRDV